ncbi:hypothetical protein Tco_1004396 [Tanacetum coccineum]|uniref:Synaptobrevin, longin-like domain protein n=1 Tax=Tanacetum coccineum TaxID=301880 RepID=A0ABQ5FD37_9ASTR
MTTLKFVDTHNMVAFLAKPAESEGFEQIVDFLNAHTIKYALTINPTIYTSCIEQFWATIVRRDLQLEDAEGVDCLSNTTIFEQLTLIGYEKISQKLTFYKAFFSPQWKFLIHTILQCLSSKTTVWNEFSSIMASAIICLATNQKFNFSKYIFKSMVKNLDNVGNFFMYPRFVQVFVNQQLDGLPSHKRIYVIPSHSRKIFGNMRRVGKCFSGRETPLFQTMVVQHQEEMGEGSANPTDPHHTPTIIQPSTSQPQKEQKPRKPKRKDTQIPYLEAEQDSGGGHRRQETIGDTITQTRSENVSKLSNDLLLARGNTLRSGKDSPKLNELMELSTNLQIRVLDLEKTKTTQAEEIVSLKRRFKKLKQKKKSRTHRLKRLYKVGLTARVESFEDEESLGEDASKQGRINAIDANEDITLVNDQDDADMFDVKTLTGDEVLAEPELVVKDVNLSIDEVTLAQTLASLKSAKVQEKGDVLEERSVPVSSASTKPGTTTTTTISSLAKASQANVQDKSKGKMVELEKPIKKKELIRLDEEIASKLQAEFDEEADHELAQILQAQKQEELSDAEKATRFNMEGKKPKDLKNKSFDSIQKMFDRAFKRVNTFVDFRTDLVEGSSKRAGTELEHEVTRKQKVDDVQEIAEVDDDQEAAKIKELIEIVPDEEEVAIDAIPLATKPPTIVD